MAEKIRGRLPARQHLGLPSEAGDCCVGQVGNAGPIVAVLASLSNGARAGQRQFLHLAFTRRLKNRYFPIPLPALVPSQFFLAGRLDGGEPVGSPIPSHLVDFRPGSR